MASEYSEIKVPKRILSTLLSALGAGVVPRNGAPYIAIGRNEEIDSLLKNCDTVSEGGAFCRFIIGRYGSGKSFLIQLIRGYALDRGFLCADADLSPERRLTGGNGAGIATYRELLTNLASKASPEGGALPTMLSRYFTTLKTELAQEGILPESADFEKKLLGKITHLLSELEGDVGGFDFGRVLTSYFISSMKDDTEHKSAAVRWLRGEFVTKTEAKAALGFPISTVISDENWYDFIKLFAVFSRKIGYRGLLIFIDECVNLYKIPNRISRESNYEKILSIFNDTLQGKAEGLGVVFGGTPQFLEDGRRGLFSYDALKSRLEDSHYSDLGYQNLSSPVIRLRRLTDNELFALVRRLTKLYMQKEDLNVSPLSDEQIEKFMSVALSKVGADELITPREVIRDYLTLLNILRDNPTATFEGLLSGVALSSMATDVDVEILDENSSKNQTKVSIFDIEL